MKKPPRFTASLPIASALLLALALQPGCGNKSAVTAKTAQYADQPPHGGTPVALAGGEYHVELVREADAGTLSGYVLDDEMEDFVRSSSPSFQLIVTDAGTPQTLVLAAVANPATGETVGDTSLFQAQADWLKTTGNFNATLHGLTVRGKTLPDVSFPFPAGNAHE
jgi:hypothetical protein